MDTTSVSRVALDPLDDSSSVQCASISRSYFSLYERCANCFLWCFCVIFSPNYRSPFCFPKCPSGSSALYGCVQIHYDMHWRFFRFWNLLRLLRVQLSIFLDTTAQNSFLRFIPLCRILCPAAVAMQCVYVWFTPFILSSDAKTARTLGSQESCCGAAWMTPLLHLSHQSSRITNWCIAVILPSWLWLHRFLKNRHMAAPVLSRPVFF